MYQKSRSFLILCWEPQHLWHLPKLWDYTHSNRERKLKASLYLRRGQSSTVSFPLQFPFLPEGRHIYPSCPVWYQKIISYSFSFPNSQTHSATKSYWLFFGSFFIISYSFPSPRSWTAERIIHMMIHHDLRILISGF